MAWGDSLTFGVGASVVTASYPSDLGARRGHPVYNGGVSGDTSTQIRTRMQADPAKWALPTIIWAGRNNFADPTTVKADIASMVASLGHSNYIVLSVLNADNATEYAGGSDYATIMQLNADLAATYGAHFLDVRSYLVSLYNPSVPQDVIDHGHDIPPSSLRSSTVHLNDAGYQDVANFVYANRSLLGFTP